MARQAVVSYLVVGLLLAAFTSVSIEPLAGATWRERAVSAVHEILTWPLLVPHVASAIEAGAADRF